MAFNEKRVLWGFGSTNQRSRLWALIQNVPGVRISRSLISSLSSPLQAIQIDFSFFESRQWHVRRPFIETLPFPLVHSMPTPFREAPFIAANDNEQCAIHTASVSRHGL